uniref:ANK_REP_REGION domain-containing protein n=1 Tax=Macrostomum lignano TaxID=282301 RepID=A0A1I8GWI0_9PLAT
MQKGPLGASQLTSASGRLENFLRLHWLFGAEKLHNFTVLLLNPHSTVHKERISNSTQHISSVSTSAATQPPLSSRRHSCSSMAERPQSPSESSEYEASQSLYSQIKQAVAAGDERLTDDLLFQVSENIVGPGEDFAKGVIFAAARDRDGLPVLRLLEMGHGVDIFRLVDSDGDSVTHLAAKSQTAETMEFLKQLLQSIEVDWNPFEARDSRQKTVMHRAAENLTDHGSTFQWLIFELEADCLTDRDADNDTVIHTAAQFQMAESMQFIKEKMNGVECFKLRGWNNRTAVHCAAFN